ncbi:MAG TPA: hypothetical protein DCY25_07485 [Bacteroidales bacterium]|nr:hypothetical protein [Bacteroidales bacterium]
MLFTSKGHAQTSPGTEPADPLKITKISGDITFDGIPDEAVWQSVPALPMVMLMPVEGNEPTEISIIKVAYDEEYLYVSGYINYKDPDFIRAIGKKRDYSSRSSDWFGFILDTFNDRENAFAFLTNPNGTRSDATIKNDIVDEDTDFNGSWNTFWDVKTEINVHGWSAEFRIPFSSLRFQTDGGRTLMGILIMRWSPAKPEMATFPAVSVKLSTSYFKPSFSRVVEFEGLRPAKPVYVTPYIITGLGQVNELNEAGTGYKMTSNPKLDAGVDLKYSITNNLTLDITANTDFAQVEADDQKINLTRYSLYFPEKRVFFLEKSDVFDFSFLEGNNLFYSRRIGLYEGNSVRIYGGLRMTGRINKLDVGFLDMQTEKYEDNPSENFGVLRLKRNVINQNSFIGGIFASRLGMNGNYNLAYGFDGQFRIRGDEYLIFRVARSAENDVESKLFEIPHARLLFEWQNRSRIGFGHDFQYTYSGESYNPGIGFERKKSFHGPVAALNYGWMPGETSSLRYHRLSLSGYNFWNVVTKLHETTNAAITWYWEAKKGFGGNFIINWFSEELANNLPLGNKQAHVPAGKYSFVYATCGYSTSTARDLSSTFSTIAGRFYDGWRFSFYAYPQLKIGTDFDFGLTYYLDYVNFPSRDMKFTNHIFGLTGLMTLTTSTSLRSFIQYNTAINRIIANIRFRFNPREGNDFWIVYDEGLNTNLQRITPELPVSSGRTILLKYTYTFRF